jgi:hypothetical protein
VEKELIKEKTSFSANGVNDNKKGKKRLEVLKT